MKGIVISFFFMLSTSCFAMMRHINPTEATGDGPPLRSIDVANIPNAVPKVETKSRYGNPPSYIVFGKRYFVLNSAKGYKKRGIASWYGTKFHERRTSSGEPYNMFAMTAANKVLPLPTFVKVTNLENGRQIIVKVNDRGPFKANRIIDLSYVAAKKLGILKTGTGLVEVDAIDPSHFNPIPQKDLNIVKQNHKPKIYLQLGSFSDYQNAEALISKVKTITSRNTRISQISFNEKTYYRVQIGPLKDVDETDILDNQLESLNLGTPITVIQ